MKEIIYPVAIKLLEDPNYLWIIVIGFTLMIGIPLIYEYRKSVIEKRKSETAIEMIVVLSMDYLIRKGLEERYLKNAFEFIDNLTRFMPMKERGWLLTISAERIDGEIIFHSDRIIRELLRFYEEKTKGNATYFHIPKMFRDVYVSINNIIESEEVK